MLFDRLRGGGLLGPRATVRARDDHRLQCPLARARRRAGHWAGSTLCLAPRGGCRHAAPECAPRRPQSRRRRSGRRCAPRPLHAHAAAPPPRPCVRCTAPHALRVRPLRAGRDGAVRAAAPCAWCEPGGRGAGPRRTSPARLPPATPRRCVAGAHPARPHCRQSKLSDGSCSSSGRQEAPTCASHPSKGHPLRLLLPRARHGQNAGDPGAAHSLAHTAGFHPLSQWSQA